MARTPVRLAPEWDARFAGGIGVSLLLHGLVLAGLVLLAPLAARRPAPLGAYTVELTDPSALGGRLPPGPIKGEVGGGPIPVAGKLPGPAGPPAEAKSPPPEARPPEPRVVEEAKAEPPAPPKPETKVEPPPPPPVEETKPEARPEPKPAPKPAPPPKEEPEVKLAAKEKPKPAPPPPEHQPAPKPQTEKPPAAAHPAPAEAETKAAPKPSARAAEQAKPAAPATASAASERGAESARVASGEGGKDAYALAAERWKAHEGGGLGGPEGGTGPIGAGGEGPGGGGQVVGLEFLAYRQQVISTIKSQWTNVINRPGLVARVRFGIARDGTVSDVRLEQSSGNPAYDSSVVRAVEHANPLPPPPARYVEQFREFVIEFHSEEPGGRGTG